MEPNKYRFGGCSFELEICLLPTMGGSGDNNGPLTRSRSLLPPSRSQPPSQTDTPIKSSMKHGSNPVPRVCVAPIPPACVGIRRKRLKGDSWCYKKVCEQVLALTATDLRQQIGSPV